MTSTKKTTGRPRRNADEVLGQLTIRMSSKLKFGLELLARAQHRSLSQAVEWALQVGLNNFEAATTSGDKDSIGAILDTVWPLEEEGARIWKIYNLAPGLLTFEETKACELIEKCDERQIPPRMVRDAILVHGLDSIKSREARDRESAMFETFYRFASKMWPAIKQVATERANAGRSISGVSLLGILGIRSPRFATPDDIYRVLDEMSAINKPADSTKVAP